VQGQGKPAKSFSGAEIAALTEFDLRKSVLEFVNQLRRDILEIAGTETESTDEEKETEGRENQMHTKRGDRAHFSQYQNTSHHTGYLIDTRTMKMRLARAVVMAAATIYLWSFTAHPAALLGFGASLFYLFIGFGAARAWSKEAVTQTLSRRKTASVNGMRSVPSWIERTHAYMWARKEFQERLRLAALGVALPGSSSTKARKYLNALFASAPAMVLASGLASATLHPYFIFIAIVPGAIIAIPFLSLKFKKAERGEVDDELPFFLIIAEMLALVEKPLVHAFEALASSDLLPKMRTEAEIVRRDVNAFGYTPEQAIDNLAASHPNAEFRSLLRGYLGSVSLGQSAAQYFQSKAETYLARLEAKYERFRENASTAGEVVLIALMIVPITGLMYGASGGVSELVLVGTIPLIALGVFFMLDRAQVKGPQDTGKEGAQILPVVTGVATAIILLALLQVELATGLLAATAAFAIPHGIAVRRRLKRDDEMLSELAEFIRAVAEGMKTGFDVASSIRHTDASRFSALRTHIRRIKYGLATGGTLDGMPAVPTLQNAGFYVKYAVFIISALAASGAASHAMLDRLAEYLGRVREQSARVKKSVAVYGFLVVLSPLFMMFTIHAMESISLFAGTDENVPGGLGSQLDIQLSADSTTVQLMYLLTALCAGVLGGKITSQTVKDTVPLGLACVIAILSPVLLDLAWPLGAPLPSIP
jgi:Flp pilus assembly protein TadB